MTESPKTPDTTYSPAQVADALVDAANRFADLIPAITDGDVASPYVADWSVDEIVRHVASASEIYGQIADQERELIATAAELPEYSAANIAAISDLTLAQCETKIRDDGARFADRVRVASADDPAVPFWAGSTANVVGLGGVLVGEYEIHGLDVAATLGRPWTIPPLHAAMTVLEAVDSAGAKWVNSKAAAGHSCSYEVRFRGGLGRIRMRFEAGELVTRPEEPWKPAVIMSADPVAFLRVFYRRQSQWNAIAKGQMMAWGTRPWNAFTLVNKFLPI